MNVTAISVAYGSMAVLPGMVASLPDDVAVVIVDNGPDDGLRGWAQGQNRVGGVKLLVAPRNLGFGHGCNLGAAGVQTEFVLFINPNSRLDPGALQHLLDAAARHPQASAFGPVLVTGAGQPRYKRNSYLMPRAAKPPRDPGTDDRPVQVLSAAVLLVRRAAFQQVGGFDQNIFLYFEDDDLSLRLRQQAGPLYIVPAARAHHDNGHSSTPSPALSRFKGYNWARSRIYTGRKHRLPLPRLSALWDGLSHTLSPRSWTDPAHRNEGIGRLRGALSMLT